jgi:hypothetical protein
MDTLRLPEAHDFDGAPLKNSDYFAAEGECFG